MIMKRCQVARVRASRSGLQAMLSLAIVSGGLTGLSVFVSSPAEAKTPGSTYCFYGKCHRVKTLAETERMVGVKQIVQASFYDSCKVDRYNPCGLTSSGEQFRPERADNAASPVYPDGTILLVRSPATQQALVLRVNNAGPYWGNRTLDVSRAAAEKLGFRGQGVANLEVRVLDAPNKAEATYSRNRKYPAVMGPVGRYASIDEAQLSLAVINALDSLPSTALVADAAASSLGSNLGNSALKIDFPKELLAQAEFVKNDATTTVQRRVAAKANRVAAKRRSHAQRRSGRRNVASVRRGNRSALRYAQHRRAKSGQRVARSRAAVGSRHVSRKWRMKNSPIVTRSNKRYRRTAELHDLNGLIGGHAPIGGLRGIPVDGGKDRGSQRIEMPRTGSVLVG